ncbi:hypothetical protein HBA55_08635 [Pseudomaricurvus alkylphenolicus]|jgi:hypothetical protein|nr:hypothetical protein [Pseudomaricurvus alkylphenolicus]
MTVIGEYKHILVEGQVVHTYPSADFDAIAIDQAFDQVEQTAASLDSWILYEHPDETAGFTSGAMGQLMERYRQLQSQGCIGVACHVDSIFGRILRQNLPAEFPLPVLIDAQRQALDDFVVKLLHEHRQSS